MLSWSLLPFKWHVSRDKLPLWQLLSVRRNKSFTLPCGDISASSSCRIVSRMLGVQRGQLLSSGHTPQHFLSRWHIHLLIQPHSRVAMLRMPSWVFCTVGSVCLFQVWRGPNFVPCFFKLHSDRLHPVCLQPQTIRLLLRHREDSGCNWLRGNCDILYHHRLQASAVGEGARCCTAGRRNQTHGEGHSVLAAHAC